MRFLTKIFKKTCANFKEYKLLLTLKLFKKKKTYEQQITHVRRLPYRIIRQLTENRHKLTYSWLNDRARSCLLAHLSNLFKTR